MKKYMKPTMESEVFATNEYISACGGIESFACINMNGDQGIRAVYKDEDQDGILDTNETTLIKYQKENDCGHNGSTIAGGHVLDPTNNYKNYDWAIIVYNNGTHVSAVVDDNPNNSNTGNATSDLPHFISFKTINHS